MRKQQDWYGGEICIFDHFRILTWWFICPFGNPHQWSTWRSLHCHVVFSFDFISQYITDMAWPMSLDVACEMGDHSMERNSSVLPLAAAMKHLGTWTWKPWRIIWSISKINMMTRRTKGPWEWCKSTSCIQHQKQTCNKGKRSIWIHLRNVNQHCPPPDKYIYFKNH